MKHLRLPSLFKSRSGKVAVASQDEDRQNSNESRENAVNGMMHPSVEYEPFLNDGIPLSLLDEFIAECGGVTVVEKMSTYEINEIYIKPRTEAWQCSFAMLKQCQSRDHARDTARISTSSSSSLQSYSAAPVFSLSSTSSSSLHTANVFISHSWNSKFLDVVTAIKHHFMNPRTVIWMDVFSLNQHKPIAKDMAWYKSQLPHGIKSMGRLLLVLTDRANSHSPLRKLTCLYEYLLAIQSQCNVSIAMKSGDLLQFQQDLQSNVTSTLKIMLSIQCHTSDCRQEQEKEDILSLVQCSIGYNGFNSIIQQHLRSWIISLIQSLLNSSSLNQLVEASLLHALGVWHLQGHNKNSTTNVSSRLDDARVVLLRAIKIRSELLGDENIDTLESISVLADVYMLLNELSEAEKLLLQAIMFKKILLGNYHDSTIANVAALAKVYIAQDRLVEAESLFQDAVKACRKRSSDEFGRESLALLSTFASLLILRKKFTMAESLLVDCIGRMRECLGEDDADTLDALAKLSDLYMSQGRSTDAEESLRTTIETMKSRLGTSHPALLLPMGHLAYLYEQHSRYLEAEGLYRDCLAIKIAEFGPNNSITLAALHNFGYFFEKQGALDVAVLCYQQCRDVLSRQQSLGNPVEINTTASLARVYLLLRQYLDAGTMLEDLLATRRRTLGEIHPDTLKTLNDLVECYLALSNFDAAVVCLKHQVHVLLSSNRDEWEPDVVAAKVKLADSLSSRQDYDEAEEIFTQLLQLTRQSLGDEDASTLLVISRLGAFYITVGDFDQAEPLLEHCLSVSRDMYEGSDVIACLPSMQALAHFYHQSGKFSEAEQLMEEIIDIVVEAKGDEDEDSLVAMNNLAEVISQLNRLDDAQELFEHCFDVRKAKLGMDDSRTLVSAHNLATLYCRQDKLQDAEPLMLQCLYVRSSLLGERDPSTLASMNNLASLYLRQGRLPEAEQLHSACWTLRKEVLGEWASDTVLSLLNVVSACKSQGRFENAENLIVTSLSKLQLPLRKDNGTIINLANALVGVYETQKKYSEMVPVMKLIVSTIQDQLGRHHQLTIAARYNLAIIMKKLGLIDEAAAVLQTCLKDKRMEDMDITPATSILVQAVVDILEQQGREEEAEDLDSKWNHDMTSWKESVAANNLIMREVSCPT